MVLPVQLSKTLGSAFEHDKTTFFIEKQPINNTVDLKAFLGYFYFRCFFFLCSKYFFGFNLCLKFYLFLT